MKRARDSAAQRSHEMGTRDSDGEIEKLKKLAALKGVETSYRSSFEQDIEADPAALVAIINALRVSSEQPELANDLSNIDLVWSHEASAGAGKSGLSEIVEPVWVFWDGEAKGPMALRHGVVVEDRREKPQVELTIKFENGTRAGGKGLNRLIPVKFDKDKDQATFEFKGTLPHGYHEAVVRIGARTQSVLIISAPWTSYMPVEKNWRALGIFAPLYALKSSRSWGIGDFSDLKQFALWALKHGADFIGTLPMLSIFTGAPLLEPSPYSPLSRTHWNELYLDLARAPELKACKKAKKLLASKAFKEEVQRLKVQREVDYAGVAKLKRQALDLLAEEFFSGGHDKSKKFREFLRLYPDVTDYAQFRGVCEKRGEIWTEWPEPLRSGQIKKGDFDEKNARTHLYAQWLAHSQLSEIATLTKEKGWGIYIDFPLSAHSAGYDVWRERDSFALEATAGAPPDPTFVHGQDWGILPLNPVGIRRNHYRYVRQSLATQMRYAGMLRLDHVMGFYRLFWVPPNLGAKRGVYVRYPVDEFFAILMLESHRHKCVLIGEDLGTVPPEVRQAMEAHGVLRMAIQQFGVGSDQFFSWMPDNAICSLNTHDLPMFASFWKGLDIDDQCDLGYFPKAEVESRKRGREDAKRGLIELLRREGVLKKSEPSLNDVLVAVLKRTAEHPVRVMQINLEDLWFETLPQNTPGTSRERPNWLRKCRLSLEGLAQRHEIGKFILKIADRRKSAARAFD
jgi:4-alpha-glucanotransferase